MQPAGILLSAECIEVAPLGEHVCAQQEWWEHIKHRKALVLLCMVCQPSVPLQADSNLLRASLTLIGMQLRLRTPWSHPSAAWRNHCEHWRLAT